MHLTDDRYNSGNLCALRRELPQIALSCVIHFPAETVVTIPGAMTSWQAEENAEA